MRHMLLVVAALSAVACEGPAGPAGESGASGGLVSSVVCSTTAPLASSVLTFVQQRYEFSDGSVMTGCAVSDAFYEYTNNLFFKAGQVGAETGTCFVGYDVDSPSAGRWEFTISAQQVKGQATYRDTGSGYNGSVVTLDCQRF